MKKNYSKKQLTINNVLLILKKCVNKNTVVGREKPRGSALKNRSF
jgi:hypothetical protein